MAQHDYVIDNQSFPATRTDLNNVLQAIVSNNSGTSAPSTTFANQIWYDSSANILYIRNEDNDANIPLLQFDQSADVAATLATVIDILDASGTNQAGTALTIKAGAGTGTGAGGAIILQTADGGSSGSSVNSHATVVTITDDGKVGVGDTTPETPIEISIANKLGSTFTGTTAGEGLRVSQSSFSAGNFVSLVEAPHQQGGVPNVRIGAMFDSGGSHIALGTSNSFGSGVTNTAMFIDQVGQTGIGNTAPDALLDVSGSGVPVEIDSTNSNTYKVQFKNNGSLTAYLGTGADSFFFANASAAQLLRVDSDGVKFGTDSAAANGLGDYEEGSFTPTYTGGTSNPTVTYTNQIGRYVKVGQLVHCSIRINTNGVSGGSGALFISGLPFAGEVVSSAFSSFLVGYSASWTGNAPQAGFLAASGTAIQLLTNSATSARSQLASSVAVSDMNTGSGATFNDTIGQITYRTG